MEENIVPAYLNKNNYISCIKIGGNAILPPLVTEERKKELNEDKNKAIEIEKKIKRKRSSIDSGVMTGSYIDSFKNGGDSQETENLPLVNPSYSTDRVVTQGENGGDSFLQSALEDEDFRAFFYSTAEKIFKDNHLVNLAVSENEGNNQVKSGGIKDSLNEEIVETSQSRKSSTVIVAAMSDLLVIKQPALVLNSELSGINKDKSSFKNPKIEVLPVVKVDEERLSPQRLVRRNSYTLESPSPVLLEHMAKESVKKKEETTNWKVLSEKKDVSKSLGFKSFSQPKPRKTWNKRSSPNPFIKTNYSPGPANRLHPQKAARVPLKRTRTFTKTKPKTESEDANFSLPCSSRTSPIHMFDFAKSVDCIPLMMQKSPTAVESNLEKYVSLNAEECKEKQSQRGDSGCGTSVSNESANIPKENRQKNITKDPSTLQNEKLDFPLQENSLPVVALHSESSLHFPECEPSSTSSQILPVHHPLAFQRYIMEHKFADSHNEQSTRDQANEADDTVSVCSSMSLSKFMPMDESAISLPSTAEDMSLLFAQLQLQHERQIAELLERQHKEKIMLAKINSNAGSAFTSRSATTLSVYDQSFENTSPKNLTLEERRSSCSRELFPLQSTGSPNLAPSQIGDNSSEKLKAAATRLTACARGYLTRRLLKTEKVQQLIDVIKESLNCAFSLQSEEELRTNDLELHKRLEHQLTAALYELQSIVSAPAAQRMAVIAVDREKLRNPPSRPSSAISSATRKSLLRRQQSMHSEEKKPQEGRSRAKSLCSVRNPGISRANSFVKSDFSTASAASSSNNASSVSRKPWR